MQVAYLNLKLLYHFSNVLKTVKEFTQMFLVNLLSRQTIKCFLPDLTFF